MQRNCVTFWWTRSFDAISLEIADTALSNVEEEFVSIQNQLSKSFNFIKENSYGGLAVRDDVKNESIDTSDIKSEQVLWVKYKLIHTSKYSVTWMRNIWLLTFYGNLRMWMVECPRFRARYGIVVVILFFIVNGILLRQHGHFLTSEEC